MNAQRNPRPSRPRFGSPARVKEVVTPLVRSAKAVTGRASKIRLLLADDRGSFETVISESTQGSRKASTARSLVQAEAKPLRTGLSESAEIATLPLVSRREVLGLMEVVASPKAISDGWKALKGLAEYGGVSLRMLEESATLQSEAESSRRLSQLARSLVRARTTGKAVREAARACFEAFGLPVIAWAVDVDLTRLTLLTSHGLPAADLVRLQTDMRSLRRPSAGGSPSIQQLLDPLARLPGFTKTTVIEGGDALIVIGGRSPEIISTARFMQPMLKEVLRRLGILALSDLHHERLDLGISWTAHELRGPLTGTRAIIDLLLQTADEESRTQHLLKRSREDLDRMSALVDGALRVTMTDEALVQQPIALTRVLQDAINMCKAERADIEILVHNKAEIVLHADPPHLTGAIANVLRNSLWHSPTSAPVEVDVLPRGTAVQIRITDQGPRVSGADREMIFDPFGRGESPRAVGRGKGLGLFIARRVIEAHGGTIKAGSSSSGAMFVIDLPVAEERRQVSAS